jgi:hypothetical protein
MAKHTPNFSVIRIESPQRIFQGSNASEISINAAHTGLVSTRRTRDGYCCLTSLETSVAHRRSLVDTGSWKNVDKGLT